MKGIGFALRADWGSGWLERGSGASKPLLPAIVEADTVRDTEESEEAYGATAKPHKSQCRNTLSTSCRLSFVVSIIRYRPIIATTISVSHGACQCL